MREAVEYTIETHWDGRQWVGKSVFSCANGWPISPDLVPADVRARLLDEYRAKKDTGAGVTITKAESGKGGQVPPLPPEQRPFNPISPYSPPVPRAQDLDRQTFDPTCRPPIRRAEEPEDSEAPGAAPWFPRY